MAENMGHDGFEGIDGLSTEDIVAASAIANGLTSTNEPERNQGDTDKDKAAPPGGTGEGGETVETEPSGVLAADGKSVIPYDVLKNARGTAAKAEEAQRAAEETARAAQEQLEAAKAELEQLKAGTQPGAETAPEADAAAGERIARLREQADAMREELPTMASMMDGFIGELEQAQTDAREARKAIETRDAADKTARETAERTTEQQEAEKVRAAIDSNPTLAYWEAHKDATAFNRASSEDELLRREPAWANKPYGERFAEAVRRTLLVIPDAPKPPETPTQEVMEARARKALETAGDVELHSLSDLPTGRVPGPDVLENLAGVDTAVLGSRFERMTNDQIEAELSRVARLPAE